MTVQEAAESLEEARQNLSLAIEQLVTMGPAVADCSFALEQAARALQNVHRSRKTFDRMPVSTLLRKLSADAGTVERLFDSAAGFYHGFMSTDTCEISGSYDCQGLSSSPHGAPLLEIKA